MPAFKFEALTAAGKPTTGLLEADNARAARGRKGKAADLGFKPSRITRVE